MSDCYKFKLYIALKTSVFISLNLIIDEVFFDEHSEKINILKRSF